MSQLKPKQPIGLALGGGAVLGAAHIGVLRALHEYNISIGWISGTSIGALVASLHAFGHNWNSVEEIAIDLSWSDITKLSFSRQGLFSNEKISDLLQRSIGDVTFEDSSIPMACIATNIATGSKVVLNTGNVAQAVMASTCIPGLFKPVRINDALLVDGGIVENVPISVLKDLGASFTIGVDLNAHHGTQEPSNLVDTVFRSFQFSMATTTALQTTDADLLITPDLSGYNLYDTAQVHALIDTGYKAASEVLKYHLGQD